MSVRQHRSSMAATYHIEFFGNIETCRTEAEIYVGAKTTEPWAILYQSSQGWVIECLDSTGVPVDVAAAAVDEARRGLNEYVNRRGENPPSGLTAEGLAFWLMEKSDGTSMGRVIDGVA